MTPPRKQFVATLLLALSSLASVAQAPAPLPAPKPPLTTPFVPTRLLILLDPAHGGPDTGARLTSTLPEKEVTLSFNNRLRALLSAANFAVISTRTSDPSTVFTADQRAEIANHDRPAVCLILHATASGSGIHLFTSALAPSQASRPPIAPRWNTAQAYFIPTSRTLANEIGAALLRAKLPVTSGQASVPPLDNLTCPAIAIELAPLPNSESKPTPVSDAAYQQRTAEAIAAALTQWRTENTPAGVAQ